MKDANDTVAVEKVLEAISVLMDARLAYLVVITEDGCPGAQVLGFRCGDPTEDEKAAFETFIESLLDAE